MNKNGIKTIGSAAALSLIMSTLPAAAAKAAPGQVTQLGGTDSYETAAKVATTNWTSTDNVILVSGEGYADSVSATVLSKQLKAPILLTQSASLNSNAKSALDILKPKNIYVVGGNASISQSIRNTLKNSGYNLIELGGSNRYETNAAVANELVKLGVDPANAMMVGGNGFSDALSASSIAAAKGEILLLGNNDETAMKSVLDFIKDKSSKVTVIGTENTVGDKVYNDIAAANRVNGGSDRFATNLNVLNSFSGDLKSDKLYIANASGARYQDALIAASLAGINSSPLVLIGGDGDTQTQNAISYIKSNSKSTTDLNLISENGVVSGTSISDINSAVSQYDNTATVNSVTANSLNQVKVVFNTQVDRLSAERTGNYEIDGNGLPSATATLQEDGRTVIINFSTPYTQSKDVDFTVKNEVLAKGSGNTIAKYEKHITFQENGVPTLDSVTSIGGNKLRVKFSEPIRISDDKLSSIKINRRSVTGYGLNKTYTKLRDVSGDWADGVDLYFNSPLPIGSNTLIMPNGDSGSKFDNAAGIPFSTVSQSFTVNSSSGNPQVDSVTSNNTDTIYIKYNQPVDEQTALESSNYKINGKTVTLDDSYVNFDYNSGDTVVRIEKVDDLLQKGENTVTVSSNVQDTFGNSIKDSTVNFYLGDNSGKPKITSSSIIDSETIRIKFNKEVTRSYAQDKGNYTITDSDGNDITYKIDSINSISIDGNSNTNFDIKLKDDALKGSKYTLTIKNVADTSSPANIMDTYTTLLAGTDDEGLNVTKIVRRADNPQAVAIFFNKTMNDSDLQNASDYMFKNGDGDIKSLPGSAIITPSYDYKSVTIEFPSGYKLGSGSGSSSVLQMGVKNVKDTDGDSLDLGSYMGDISIDNDSYGPSIIAGTAKMTFDGTNITVKVSLTEALDSFDVNDFTVDGYTPDSGYTSGNDVILTYRSGVKNNQKINDIKRCSSTTLNIGNTNSMDAAGRNIRSGSTTVYVPPMINKDMFMSSSNTYNNNITVVFNQDIDDDLVSSYNDDFIFKDNTTGKNLNVTGVSIDGKDVIYRFNNDSIHKGDSVTISANNSSSINIRGENHNTTGYSTYVPSQDDLNGYTISIN
ncbi:putative cell wall-binding protein/acyl carrier protein [Clostridium algifaecis]|uniref:Cell wall-binding protein/acyl carrier protein n=1 Tax=Clostridium algifaecis TaxID=1472040 RepID=A0ABS4KVR5_9CLOT|nr:cell wall-binding repeat-containing protein [Clostridium algifaecis]MBP2033725.1 putative cell wall-binding protein/acyl carrier protein [Clostridium algifaecis]